MEIGCVSARGEVAPGRRASQQTSTPRTSDEVAAHAQAAVSREASAEGRQCFALVGAHAAVGCWDG